MKLEDFKIEQLQNVGAKRIYGTLVEGLPHFEASSSSSKWVAIRPCLCVWDSPDSPCRCPTSLLYWALESDIRKSERVDVKSHDGEDIYSFDIDKKAQLGIEFLRGRPISSIPADQKEALRKIARIAAKIKRLKQARAQSAGCVSTGDSGSGVIELSWDDFTEGFWDVLDDLDSIFDAGEASGVDWETVLGIVIIFL